LSGGETLKELKGIEAMRAIPVVALSANPVEGSIRKGLEAGFHGYLIKPVKVAEVLSGIEAALEEGIPLKASEKHKIE
tara:strand:- start:215 stop:448 length:234 start_codon:yes stop_codon:yes gene_type:complete